MTGEVVLRSKTQDVADDIDAIFDLAIKEGWSDGLPIIPPTPDRVRKMIAGASRRPEEVLGNLGPLWGEVSVEKVAINAVMAGCRPEYFPVVLAAVEGMMDDSFNVWGIQTTTNPATMCMVVNGPVIEELGFNSQHGVFGPGSRANSTVGRAVRLVMQNVGGGIPGHGDQSTQGSPGKYAMCIAENEKESPWEPLSVELGFPAGSSTVTVFPVTGPHHVVCLGDGHNAEVVLRNLGRAIACHGNNAVYMQDPVVLVVVGPDTARTAAQAGFSRESARAFIFDNVVARLVEFGEGTIKHFRQTKAYSVRGDELRPVLQPDRLKLVVAGGPGEHCAFFPSFNVSYSVTRPVSQQIPTGN